MFEEAEYETENKLRNFEKYVRRQDISRFIARYELFKMQTNIKGSIIECGVHHGGGLMAWAKLSAALEPYALHRKVVGFDTFEGFVDIEDKNNVGKEEISNEEYFTEDYDIYEELNNIIKKFDENRYLSEFEKVDLVKGDAKVTIPKYLEDNEHLLISLLFMDFDLYEPTKVALKELAPRMSAGSIIAFDEVNNEFWPGETKAMLEELNLKNYELKKFKFDPNISYITL
ncbi:TylF/MycF/NovP-related O-methyltransferase [Salinibacter ruber]|uniref:TylF/MycF/NovP-related O-methyltransferase n=1 Tax=Salinibacter ruber TaxID=146919 RepID=UPI0020736874|nr:TylF/MycF/NovP-related O-methyltransferase [Salinibacter ruber]